MDATKDFLDIHNDDLSPIDTYEGITIYTINYEAALERNNENIRERIRNREDAEVRKRLSEGVNPGPEL